MLVCPTCWEPDQPQLQLGMYPVDDPQGVRNPRPDRSYVASGPLADGFLGEGSRIFQWGWNPVGGGYTPIDGGTPNYLVSQTAVGTVTIELDAETPIPPPPIFYSNAVETVAGVDAVEALLAALAGTAEPASAIDSVAAVHTRPTTFDPLYTNANGTLSGGDLVFTLTLAGVGTFGCTYGTRSKNTGKFYFEIVNTVESGFGGSIYNNWGFCGGISTSARNITNDILPGSDATGWGFSNRNSLGLSTDTSTWHNGVMTDWVGIPQIPAAGYLGVAVDLDAGKVWFCANGTWVGGGNPATGTSPTYAFTANTTMYPAAGQGSYSPFGVSTANFGATAFLGTVPTGFVSWNTVS